jgi:hypothetical protein
MIKCATMPRDGALSSGEERFPLPQLPDRDARRCVVRVGGKELLHRLAVGHVEDDHCTGVVGKRSCHPNRPGLVQLCQLAAMGGPGSQPSGVLGEAQLEDPHADNLPSTAKPGGR